MIVRVQCRHRPQTVKAGNERNQRDSPCRATLEPRVTIRAFADQRLKIRQNGRNLGPWASNSYRSTRIHHPHFPLRHYCRCPILGGVSGYLSDENRSIVIYSFMIRQNGRNFPSEGQQSLKNMYLNLRYDEIKI